jgi:hypothetical protein
MEQAGWGEWFWDVSVCMPFRVMNHVLDLARSSETVLRHAPLRLLPPPRLLHPALQRLRRPLGSSVSNMRCALLWVRQPHHAD